MTEPGLGSSDMQVDTPRGRDAVTYRRSKGKFALYLLGGLLFAWLGLGLPSTRPVVGLLVAAFGILIAALALAALVFSRPLLCVDGDGFELVGLGNTKVRWADVGPPPPYAGSILGFEAIRVPCNVAQETRSALLGRRKIGKELALMNWFEASLREIHEEMCVRYQDLHPAAALASGFPADESDISQKALVATQLGLLVLYLVVATTLLDQALISALRAFATCLGLVGVLFVLAFRTIRWRGDVASTSGPHPRFPTGRHPRPRLQFLIGMVLTSALFLLIFWPWSGRAQ